MTDTGIIAPGSESKAAPPFDEMMMEEQTPTGYPITATTVIEKRPDGSYVLDGIYHVADMPEYADKLKEIMELVAANPERVVKLPAPTEAELLATGKAAKFGELAEAFDAACQTATVNSSLGFEADATRKAKDDVDGIITALESGVKEAPVEFCGADNKFHDIDLAGAKTLMLEIIGNGQRLYDVKWGYRAAIEGAGTVAELAAIEISFNKE